MPQETSLEATIHEALGKLVQSFAAHRYGTPSELPGPDPLLTRQQNAGDTIYRAEPFHTHLSLTPNELFREALTHSTAATGQGASLLTELGQPPVGISPSVAAHDATSPATTFPDWCLLASDRATVNALPHHDHEPPSCLVAPHRQQLLDQLGAIKQRHCHTLSDRLTRINFFAKAEINDPERT